MLSFKNILIAIIDYIVVGICALVYACFIGVRQIISQILSKLILKSLIIVTLFYFVIINYVFLLEAKYETKRIENEYQYWYNIDKTKENSYIQEQYQSVINEIDGIKNGVDE